MRPVDPHVEALAAGREYQHGEHGDDKRGDEPGRGMLRRHPLAFVGGLILLVALLPAGYLYCHYRK